MVTRGSNTYGPNQYPEKFVPLFVTNAIDEQPLPLYGDGRQRRDWLAVEDHCSAIEHVFFQGEPGQIYNIGGGNEWENIAVAEQIVRHCARLSNGIRSMRIGGVRSSQANFASTMNSSIVGGFKKG